MKKPNPKKNKVRKIKKINCLCPKNIADVCPDDCFCPLHWLSLKEWRKSILEYYEKKGIVYTK